jgi:hypothetical protein
VNNPVYWPLAIVAKLTLSLGYLGGLLLLLQRRTWLTRLRWLAPVGRLALTNYVAQTAFLMFIKVRLRLGPRTHPGLVRVFQWLRCCSTSCRCGGRTGGSDGSDSVRWSGSGGGSVTELRSQCTQGRSRRYEIRGRPVHALRDRIDQRLVSSHPRNSAESHIAAIANEEQRHDATSLVALMRKVSKQEPRMWGPSIIGFGSYDYKYASGHEGDSALTGFAARRTSCYIARSPKPALENLVRVLIDLRRRGSILRALSSPHQVHVVHLSGAVVKGEHIRAIVS